MSRCGVVVVGIGRAGQARVNELKIASVYADVFPVVKDVILKGYVSRRTVAIEGATQITLEDALNDPEVKVVIIATENATHESIARQCLSAGRHVLVEYPRTVTHQASKELSALAKQKGVCFCEEDIVVFTEDFRLLKEHAATRTLQEGFMSIEGTMNPWMMEWSTSGSPFVYSASIMQTFLCVFGDLSPVEASIIRTDEKHEAHAVLRNKDGGVLNFIVKRIATDKPFRNKTYEYKFTDGSTYVRPDIPYLPPQPPHKPGLFMKDFINFMDHMKNGVERDPPLWVTERGVELGEQLYEMAKQSAKSVGLS